MAYPDDKDTFRSVTGYTGGPVIDANKLKAGDQNNMGSWLENLQDIFGYGIKMGYATVKAFFDWVVTQIGLKYDKTGGDITGDLKASGYISGATAIYLTKDGGPYSDFVGKISAGGGSGDVQIKMDHNTASFFLANHSDEQFCELKNGYFRFFNSASQLMLISGAEVDINKNLYCLAKVGIGVQPTTIELEVVGKIKATGYIDGGTFQVAGTPGASGSFTTVDGKTVTVTSGIITSIV